MNIRVPKGDFSAFKPVLKVLGSSVALLLLVYVPTFALTSALKPRPVVLVPLVIGVSLMLALAAIAAISHRREGWRAWGFRFCASRYLFLAVIFGLPFGLTLTILDYLFPTSGPLSGLRAALWVQALYFVVGAPFQEEIIFRGLLQTVASRYLKGTMPLMGLHLAPSAILVAFLFGLVHLSLNPLTAFSAFILGLIAGELRERSSSLVPAILVHAIFNACALLWIGVGLPGY